MAFFYLPLIVADLDIHSTLYIPKDKLDFSLFENGNISSNKLSDMMKLYKKSNNAMYFFYRAFIQVLSEKDKIIITYNTIRLKKECNDKKTIVANIIAEDYYKLAGDKTNHIVTLIPEENQYISVDPYKILGYKEFDNWSECLSASQKYDWYKFNDFALSF